MIFVGITTITAGILGVKDIFWPMAMKPGTQFQGYLDTILMIIFIVGVILVLFEATRRCWRTLHGAPLPSEAFGSPVYHEEPVAVGRGSVSGGCC
jgi:hypothetical protein